MESGTIFRPIIKWAGGKTQLLAELCPRLPKSFECYHEPFIGGGAVFLATAPDRAIINDINPQLVNLYRQIRDNVTDFIDILQTEDSAKCDKEYYYSVRARYNSKIQNNVLDVETAALLVWCNKHCFNGLYRVNSKGLFNVPYNNKITGSSFDKDNVLAISAYLNRGDISIDNTDFEKACEQVKPGDLVYLDPPYVPVSTTADFTSYSKDGFSFYDHKRVASVFRRLSDKGAYVIATNNNTPFVHELYEGFVIEPISVKRMINRDANKRTGKEVIIKNY